MNKVILVALIFFSVSGYSQQTELKLASDIWPPFTNIETKKTFATDLVTEALKRIDRKTKIKIVEFGDLLDGIKSKDYDGSAALWMTDERKEFLLFSEPYLHNQLILVGRKGSDITLASYEELTGKRIGIVENYAYGSDMGNVKDVDFIDGKSDQQNLERLLSDQIDYMLVDALLIQYLLKYQVNDVTEFLEIGTRPLVVKPLYFVLGKHVVDADQIISSFNEEIYKMIADGAYNEILELNWLQADLDGDGQMEFVLKGDKAGKEAPRNVYGVDASSVQDASTQRYYVDGKIYSGWDNVPQQYKNEIILGSQSFEGMGVRLDFK